MAETDAPWISVLRALDDRAVPALHRLVSVRTERERARLRRRALPFLDPAGARPRLSDVDATADAVIAEGQRVALALGAVGGVAGGLSAPPEAVGWAIATVRLGQRLAIVYGFDPVTPRGQAVVLRALAAGFGTSLPDGGPAGLRVTELVALADPRGEGGPRTVGAQLVQAVVAASVRLVGGRPGRLVPLLSSGLGASENPRASVEAGQRMKDVLRRLAETASTDDVVEALELLRPGEE